MSGGRRTTGITGRLLAVAAACALAACASRVEPPATQGSAPGLTLQSSSLAPGNGGELIAPSTLAAGDILLSSVGTLQSLGIQLATFAPVSHALIYLGDARVAEAVGDGVQVRSIRAVLDSEQMVVAFRDPQLTPEQAAAVRSWALAQVGTQYNTVGVVLSAPFVVNRRLCEVPLVPGRIARQRRVDGLGDRLAQHRAHAPQVLGDVGRVRRSCGLRPCIQGPQGLVGRLQADRIQRYAARMNRLIGDLLDVASLDAGLLAVTPTRGDAAVVISEAVETFRAAASAKEIALETEITGQPLRWKVDSARMLQVLANLITNAIKFTPRGGAIRVHGERREGELRLSVTDTGVGIPPDLLERIFERFWQVGVNDRRGLGLGLYISRSIVKAHGGRIWAESADGAGSTFFVTLPTAPV